MLKSCKKAKCFITDCGTPVTPLNGDVRLVTPSITTYQATALQSCTDGYDVVGNEIIECLADGNWSSSITCLIKGLYITLFLRTHSFCDYPGKKNQHLMVYCFICFVLVSSCLRNLRLFSKFMEKYSKFYWNLLPIVFSMVSVIVVADPC